MLADRIDQLLLYVEGLERFDTARRSDPGQRSEVLPLLRSRKLWFEADTRAGKALLCSFLIPLLL